MLGGGVDATTLVAALGAGPPPPECRWGRRPHRGATALFRTGKLIMNVCRTCEVTAEGSKQAAPSPWIKSLNQSGSLYLSTRPECTYVLIEEVH